MIMFGKFRHFVGTLNVETFYKEKMVEGNFIKYICLWRADILHDKKRSSDMQKININKNAFQSKAHLPLGIESQTLTIWPWNDSHLDMTLTSFITMTSDQSN